jgi:hypothetical protein
MTLITKYYNIITKICKRNVHNFTKKIYQKFTPKVAFVTPPGRKQSRRRPGTAAAPPGRSAPFDTQIFPNHTRNNEITGG